MGAFVKKEKPLWQEVVHEPYFQTIVAGVLGLLVGGWWMESLGASSGWVCLMAFPGGVGAVFAARWIQKVCKNSDPT